MHILTVELTCFCFYLQLHNKMLWTTNKRAICTATPNYKTNEQQRISPLWDSYLIRMVCNVKREEKSPETNEWKNWKFNKKKRKYTHDLHIKGEHNARAIKQRKHDRGRKIPSNFLAHDKLNGQKWQSSCKWYVWVCVCVGGSVFIPKSTNIYMYQRAIISSHNDSGLPVESLCFYLKRGRKQPEKEKKKTKRKVRKTNQIYTTIKSEMVFDK